MQVQKIEAHLTEYKAFLREDRTFPELYKWESLRTFQDQWDPAAADFGAMYVRCLQNRETQRLWDRPAWFPKEMMLEFIKVDPDFVRDLFLGLMEESWDAHMRITQVAEACDEFLNKHNHLPGLWRENQHYHDDYEMLFLYLSFAYPEQYTLYKYPAFRETLQQLGTHDLPAAYDLVRFMKITRALYKFLIRDEELLKLHLARRDPDVHYMGNSMLIVHDFYHYFGTE